MQDFTGVPAIVDLAAMRDAMKGLGGKPGKINPLVPVDLVIDHSVQVDQFGTNGALAFNTDIEYQRNRERYVFLAGGRKPFIISASFPPDGHLPPGQSGISGQRGDHATRRMEKNAAFPDTLGRDRLAYGHD